MAKTTQKGNSFFQNMQGKGFNHNQRGNFTVDGAARSEARTRNMKRTAQNNRARKK